MSDIYNHTPYTYLIKWSSTNMKYYGVRYAKNCHPNDLWTSYFTSSDYVEEYRKIHGEPDIIQIRKIFPDDPISARRWESKVLYRLQAGSKLDYLNKMDNYVDTLYESTWLNPEFVEKHSKTMTERNNKNWDNPDYRENMSNRLVEWHSIPENRENTRNRTLQQWSDPEFKAKMKRKVWWNNGSVSRMEEFCPGEGFVRGRIKSHMQNMFKSMTKRKSSKGIPYWNNGTTTVKSEICPEGFVAGMLRPYNNGIEELMSICKPAPDWQQGKLKIKANVPS